MNRYIELMEKENRTEKEDKEYTFLEKQYRLYSLVKMARDLGNKNPYNNFMVQDAYAEYEQAKENYGLACKEV